MSKTAGISLLPMQYVQAGTVTVSPTFRAADYLGASIFINLGCLDRHYAPTYVRIESNPIGNVWFPLATYEYFATDKDFANSGLVGSNPPNSTVLNWNGPPGFQLNKGDTILLMRYDLGYVYPSPTSPYAGTLEFSEWNRICFGIYANNLPVENPTKFDHSQTQSFVTYAIGGAKAIVYQLGTQAIGNLRVVIDRSDATSPSIPQNIVVEASVTKLNSP